MLKRNITFAQTIRLGRLCTADKEFQLNCTELRNKLTERRYKEQEINKSIQRIHALTEKSS